MFGSRGCRSLACVFEVREIGDENVVDVRVARRAGSRTAERRRPSGDLSDLRQRNLVPVERTGYSIAPRVLTEADVPVQPAYAETRKVVLEAAC